MESRLKEIAKIEFSVWFDKQLGFYLYYKTDGKKKTIQLSVWEYHKIKELKGYEDEWFSNWWKHITIWKNY